MNRYWSVVVVVCLLITAPAWGQRGGEFDAPGGDGGRGGFGGPGGDGGNGEDGGGRGRGGRGFGGRGFGPQPNLMFTAIDIDGDGVITTRELRKAIVALKQLDADKDGNITLAEITPPNPFENPTQFADTLMQNDRNGDGMLTADEVPPQFMPMLQGADTNNDGAIDANEITAAMENFRGRGRGGRGGRGGDADQFTRQLMQGDRNGDGRLTPDELSPQAVGMLRNADTNNDGAIDAGEMQAAARQMGGRARGFRGGGRGGEGLDGGQVPPGGDGFGRP